MAFYGGGPKAGPPVLLCAGCVSFLSGVMDISHAQLVTGDVVFLLRHERRCGRFSTHLAKRFFISSLFII